MTTESIHRTGGAPNRWRRLAAGRIIVIGMLVAMLLGVVPGSSPAAAATSGVTIDNFPTDVSSPQGIVEGPDGNMWFTNAGNHSIGRISPAGLVTTFTHPSVRTPWGIAVGPDGNLWFANRGNNSIGRITTAGAITSFTGTGISEPWGIAAGPDGNLWFGNPGNDSIGRITPSGAVSNFTDPSMNETAAITAGPDGNLWFGNHGSASIGRITPSGVVSSFPIPGGQEPVAIGSGPDGNVWFATPDKVAKITPSGAITTYTGEGIWYPNGITTGPDGNLWFANSGSWSIGRVTPEGVVSNFTGPGLHGPWGIASGPDGNIWFTNETGDSIGRITTAGVVTDFPNDISNPQWIVSGPDANLWFTNRGNDSIGRITPGGVMSSFTDPTISAPNGITVGPDGALWFTSEWNDSIGRITTAGAVSSFTHASIDAPMGIATGSDGNLWFTNSGNNTIGRITTAGAVTSFSHPSMNQVSEIVAGPDGNLWFPNHGGPSIGRITPAGVVSSFTDPNVQAPSGIGVGPDGNVWFTTPDKIGKITAAGAITTYTGPGIWYPNGITTGPDGNVWFTNSGSNSIGMATPAGVISNYQVPSVQGPLGIAAGTDGNLWFTNTYTDSIGRAALVPDPTGALEVTVVDGSAAPVPGLSVWLTGASSASATTDATGVAAFASLPPGTYDVTVNSIAGSFVASSSVDVLVDQTAALQVEALIGTVTAVDAPGATVSTDDAGLTLVAMQRPEPVDVTIEFEATCAGGAEPLAASVLLGAVDFAAAPVTVGSSTYTVTIPAAELETATLTTRVTCPAAAPVELVVGRVVLFDPSGVVTDADTGLPVAGANVSLYQVPGWSARVSPDHVAPDTCESNLSKPVGADWSQLPPLNLGSLAAPSSGEIDPAMNPQVTGADGSYGWDVVTGCWYVTVEADGYVTTTSPVVGVPPEVVDLDIELPPTVCGIEGSGPFSDVPGTHVFCSQIEWLVNSGITTGYDDGTFRPTVSVSRQAMAAFLWRRAGEPTPSIGEQFFADVGPTHPFYVPIQWMAGAALSTGTPQPGGLPLFKPVDPVSRQATAAFLARGATASTSDACLAGGDGPFSDVSATHPFCEAIAWLAESGIASGYDDGTFRPTVAVSRQAMASFLAKS